MIKLAKTLSEETNHNVEVTIDLVKTRLEEDADSRDWNSTDLEITKNYMEECINLAKDYCNKALEIDNSNSQATKLKESIMESHQELQNNLKKYFKS